MAPDAEAPPRAWSRRQRAALCSIVLLGAVGRSAYVARPVDHRLLAPWREADYVQIARNFHRDGLDIFHPEIDWRGDAPGYAEMELPVIPWVGALGYRVFGYHEWLLRLPATVLGILTLLVFVRLARHILPPPAALLAVAAFALNPLAIGLGNAIQPDPLMLCLALVAIAVVWTWDTGGGTGRLLRAAALTAAAILAKSPAAYLGLVIAYVALHRVGWRAVARWEMWAAAVIAFLPPFAWYTWAHHFWTRYGLSLGLSNESHYIGLDMFHPPRFLVGILKWETLGVFTPAGWLLAALAPWWREPWRSRLLVWYGAIWVFYLVSARTSGDNWAFYYHAVSAPPGCLLMGAGFAALWEGRVRRGTGRQRRLGWGLALATVAGLVGATAVEIHRRDSREDWREMRACMLEFAPHVPPAGRIVVNGGTMFDEYGKPVAHNESMAFTWMDRKGFNYGAEELGPETLERIAARGGRYWIVRRDELERDHLHEMARQRYRAIAQCAYGYVLYDLQAPPGSTAR